MFSDAREAAIVSFSHRTYQFVNSLKNVISVQQSRID